jgi:hypothetical protein
MITEEKISHLPKKIKYKYLKNSCICPPLFLLDCFISISARCLDVPFFFFSIKKLLHVTFAHYKNGARSIYSPQRQNSLPIKAIRPSSDFFTRPSKLFATKSELKARKA